MSLFLFVELLCHGWLQVVEVLAFGPLPLIIGLISLSFSLTPFAGIIGLLFTLYYMTLVYLARDNELDDDNQPLTFNQKRKKLCHLKNAFQWPWSESALDKSIAWRESYIALEKEIKEEEEHYKNEINTVFGTKTLDPEWTVLFDSMLNHESVHPTLVMNCLFTLLDVNRCARTQISDERQSGEKSSECADTARLLVENEELKANCKAQQLRCNETRLSNLALTVQYQEKNRENEDLMRKWCKLQVDYNDLKKKYDTRECVEIREPVNLSKQFSLAMNQKCSSSPTQPENKLDVTPSPVSQNESIRTSSNCAENQEPLPTALEFSYRRRMRGYPVSYLY